jgi:hypothetical protein
MANQGAAYGTKGTAAAGNHPGYRAGAVLAVDTTGNVWLFGGNGIDGSGKTGDLKTSAVLPPLAAVTTAIRIWIISCRPPINTFTG